jgi:adenylylsulfate kinase-like enzyme
MARSLIGDSFVEVHINTSLQECQKRDVKGLYQKAAQGVITNMIGVAESNPYEKPLSPDIDVETGKSIAHSVDTILSYLQKI